MDAGVENTLAVSLVGDTIGLDDVPASTALPYFCEYEAPTPCPPGYSFYSNRAEEGFGSCLRVVEETAAYEAAATRCGVDGAHLLSVKAGAATPTDGSIVKFVQGLVTASVSRPASLWTGAGFVSADGGAAVWQWSDGFTPAASVATSSPFWTSVPRHVPCCCRMP